jgi:DNA repair ATPase RecN
MERILASLVDFLMAFVSTLRQLHVRAAHQEPVDMDVDVANLDADDLPQRVQQGEVTELMEELARSAMELAAARNEREQAIEQRDHAQWHCNRLQGEKDVAEQLLRELNTEYDMTVREVGRLREEIRRHNEVCPNEGPIFVSKAGRRWHRTRGCNALQNYPTNVDPLQQCAHCTGSRMNL